MIHGFMWKGRSHKAEASVASVCFVLLFLWVREPLALVRPCDAASAIRTSVQLLTEKQDVNKNASARG